MLYRRPKSLSPFDLSGKRDWKTSSVAWVRKWYFSVDGDVGVGEGLCGKVWRWRGEFWFFFVVSWEVGGLGWVGGVGGGRDVVTLRPIRAMQAILGVDILV